MKKGILMAVLLGLFMVGCSDKKAAGTTGKAAEEKVYKIGITQIVAHPALDKARDGFKKAFEEAGMKVEFEEKNAAGEMTTANLIATGFVNNKVDLIYAIATPTAQAAVQNTKEIPVVFSAVTDPKTAGLLNPNVTGVSDAVDIKQQLQLLIKVNPKVKNVGVLFNSAEQNSKVQVEQLKAAAKELGLTVVEKGVTQVSEMPQAIDSLMKDSDAIYLPTDNLVASTIKLIADKTNTAKKILFSAEPGMVEGGALITQGVDYYEIGKAAGKLAIEILKNGKKPADLPFQTVPTTDIVINQKTLGILGITIPEDIKSKARMVGK